MMVKMQHSVQRGFQGYCLSLSGGFSASRLVRWLLGFSACPAASRLRGFAASRLARRLLGFAASRLVRWLLGFSASWLLGLCRASRLLGFSACVVLRGFSASRLVSGFSASRLLVAFLGPFCPCFVFWSPNSVVETSMCMLLISFHTAQNMGFFTSKCLLSFSRPIFSIP